MPLQQRETGHEFVFTTRKNSETKIITHWSDHEFSSPESSCSHLLTRCSFVTVLLSGAQLGGKVQGPLLFFFTWHFLATCHPRPSPRPSPVCWRTSQFSRVIMGHSACQGSGFEGTIRGLNIYYRWASAA